MPHDNIAIVRDAHVAMSRGDSDAFVRGMHEDVEGISRVMAAEGAVYKGHEGMRRFVEDVRTVFPDFQSQVVRVVAYDDAAVVVKLLFRGRAQASGVDVEQTTWQAVKFRDGKAFWFSAYETEVEALEAAGLAAP